MLILQKLSHFLILLLYLFPTFSFGSDKKSNQHGLNIMQWNEKNGVPGNIQAMIQTPDGYLWIGSENGITRFDGNQATLYNRHSVGILTEDDCSSLFVSHDSVLYCGMYNGLATRYRKGSFELLGGKEIFKGKTIITICEDQQGNLFFATDGTGIVKYDGEKFSYITKKEGLLSDGVQTICRGKENDIWVGTDSGLSCILGNKIFNYSEKEGLVFKDISSLFYDSRGWLWIGGYQGELMVLTEGRFSMKLNIKPSIASAITAMQETPDGSLWIGTAEEGICIYNPFSESTIIINTSNGLSSDIITTIKTDIEGDMLTGTQGGGLNRLKRNLLTTYTTSDGLPSGYIMSLFANNDGDIWMTGGEGKIGVYRNGTFTDRSSRFGLTGRPVFSICESRDKTVWAAAPGELVAIGEKGNKRVFPSHTDLPNTLFHAVYVARDGTVWAGTDAGIYLIREGKISTLTLKDGLTDEKIFCFFEDDHGRMWIGTQEGGINIYHDGKINSITRKEGLSDNLILCFYLEKDGDMWVGTGHDGLNRIDGKTGAVTQLGQAVGYPRIITYITEDQKGNLWLGSGDGIIVVKKSDLESFSPGKMQIESVYHFGLPEGMATTVCTGGTFPSGCIKRPDKFWFATEKGIVEADPESVIMPTYNLNLLIQDVLVNNELKGSIHACDLSPGVNHIEILYTAPSFIDPERLTFRYLLENFDTGWIDVGSRRTAFYTKLSPGSYTFRVQVRNHHGQWSNQAATIRIHVKPYFYQTPWFVACCFAFCFLFIYLFIKYRLRQIRDKELEILVLKRTEEIRMLNEELEQKVIDRTAQLVASNTELETFSYSVSHDLRAPVRRIEGLIQALNEDYTQHLDNAGKDFLARISESVANMRQLIEELLKLSRIARQELEKTDVNISGMAQDICNKLKIANPQRNVKVKIMEKMVFDGDARLVQIALQNLLDNAWKYTGRAENPMIEIGTVKKNGKTVIFVRDNGVGFDMGHYDKLFTPFQRLHSDDLFTGTGIGLATVKRIILKHGGAIWAESEPEKGTTFFFILK